MTAFHKKIKIFLISFKIIMWNVLFGTVETKITQKHGIQKNKYRVFRVIMDQTRFWRTMNSPAAPRTNSVHVAGSGTAFESIAAWRVFPTMERFQI